jgi:hypothetical protein
MIIDSIIGAVANLLVGLFNSLPDYNMPSDIAQIPTLLNTVFTKVGELRMWVPVSTIASMGIALFVAFGVSLAVRLVRLVIAYIPTMGGSQQ